MECTHRSAQEGRKRDHSTIKSVPRSLKKKQNRLSSSSGSGRKRAETVPELNLPAAAQFCQMSTASVVSCGRLVSFVDLALIPFMGFFVSSSKILQLHQPLSPLPPLKNSTEALRTWLLLLAVYTPLVPLLSSCSATSPSVGWKDRVRPGGGLGEGCC